MVLSSWPIATARVHPVHLDKCRSARRAVYLYLQKLHWKQMIHNLLDNQRTLDFNFNQILGYIVPVRAGTRSAMLLIKLAWRISWACVEMTREGDVICATTPAASLRTRSDGRVTSSLADRTPSQSMSQMQSRPPHWTHQQQTCFVAVIPRQLWCAGTSHNWNQSFILNTTISLVANYQSSLSPKYYCIFLSLIPVLDARTNGSRTRTSLGLEAQGQELGQGLEVQGQGLVNWSSRTRSRIFLKDNNGEEWLTCWHISVSNTWHQ